MEEKDIDVRLKWLGLFHHRSISLYKTNSSAGVLLCDVPETLICLAAVELASILQWDG
ncbi:hypothetical protein YC2023_016560 [Brassica napus]